MVKHKYPFNIKLRYPLIYIFIGLFLFWFSILFFSGSLSSGYHFVDDHQILEINQKLSSYNFSVLDVSKEMILDDFNKRFRPLFYFYKVLETKLFGINFLFWSIYTGILAVMTSLFLYLFTKTVGFSPLESAVFSILPLLGKQSEIWWRLGTNETIGTFFMSLCLLFMGLSIYSKRRRLFFAIFFLISVVLMSLCKESFILLIPAILFWQIWLYKERNNLKWIGALKNNSIILSLLFFIFTVEILIIKFYIGVNKVSYAGIEIFQPSKYFYTAIKLADQGSFRLILLVAIVLVVFYCNRSTLEICLNNFIYPLILLLLICIPQIILYAKTGFWARYIMPGFLGYFVFIIYMLKFIRTNKNTLILKLSSKQVNTFNTFLLSLGISFILLSILVITNQKLDALLLNYISLLKGKPIAPHWVDKIHNLGGIALLISCALSIVAILLKIKKGHFYSLALMWSLLFFYLINNLGISVTAAREFAIEGKSTNALLTAIIENTEKDDLILIVADPAYNYEYGASIKIYLNIIGKRNNLYVYKLLTRQNYRGHFKALIKKFNKYYGSNTLENIRNKDYIKCIALFPETEKPFLQNSAGWFNLSKFKRTNYCGFVIFNKQRT